jgi:OOP family OmpA-OmpF porin
MKFAKGIFVAALVVLAGCSSRMDAVSMLDRAQPVGSPYTKYLADEYRILADSLSGGFGGHYFFSQGQYIARKGLAAVDGMIVEPETLNNKNVSMVEAAEMAEARGKLVEALDAGGRERAPDIAANAQAHFDCWALEQESFPGEDVPCRGQFQLALDQLNKALAIAPPPSSMPAPEGAASSGSEFPGPITEGGGVKGPLQQASYQVFFDWDKSNISASAHSVIDTVSQQIGGHNDIKKIVIVGHTDTSGGEKYNMKLSVRRAEAVRKVLMNEGIPASKIRIEGRGKTDLLVKTPDGVREPQNRRAQITFE